LRSIEPPLFPQESAEIVTREFHKSRRPQRPANHAFHVSDILGRTQMTLERAQIRVPDSPREGADHRLERLRGNHTQSRHVSSIPNGEALTLVPRLLHFIQHRDRVILHRDLALAVLSHHQLLAPQTELARTLPRLNR